MVGKIKKIQLQFVGTGIYDEFQAYVCIYDLCGNMIYHGKTYNGKININLKTNTAYRIKARLYDECINKVFYVMKRDKIIMFVFQRALIPRRTITFLLKDANYNNLPIEKGEIILCHKQ